MTDPNRAYGTDDTDDFSTLVEAERQDDGSVHFRTVIMTKEGTE